MTPNQTTLRRLHEERAAALVMAMLTLRLNVRPATPAPAMRPQAARAV